MATNETDILIDKLSETVFPYLTDLDYSNEMSTLDLQVALSEEYEINEYIAEKLVSAWEYDRHKELVTKSKKISSPDAQRIKILQTFVKEVL